MLAIMTCASFLAQEYYRNMSGDGLARTDSPGPLNQRREVTDPRTMRALTHPIRLALLEVLLLEGPLTATRAGELIGEPPNSCSFHLRQLAKYGFVEEAAPGPGRNRPWRLTTVGTNYSGVRTDPEARVAARGLQRMLLERYFARVEAFIDIRATYSAEWQQATGASQAIVHLAPDELSAINAQFIAVLDRYRDRLQDPALRPANSAPIEVLLFAYPVRPQGQ
jgi:Helix-turn-helix domain